MKQIIRFISAPWLMGGFFILLAFAMALATFIENDYGVVAAKGLVYNSWWFELIFLILALNMAGNIIFFKSGVKKNFSLLLFHLSFLVVITGSVITRYIGFEGMIHLREGESSNIIVSTDTNVIIVLKSADDSTVYSKKVFLSPVTADGFKKKLISGDDRVKVRSVAYIPGALSRPVEVEGGNPIVGIVFSDSINSEEYFIEYGKKVELNGIIIGFEPESDDDCEVIIRNEAVLKIISRKPFSEVSMKTDSADILPSNYLQPLKPDIIYDFGSFSIARGLFFPSAVMQPFAMTGVSARSLPDAVVFKVDYKDKEYKMIAYGKTGQIGKPSVLNIDGLTLSVRYGSVPIELPFSLHLNKFILDRYPGSQSPSAYTSIVTLKDAENSVDRREDIFMNNILSYRGYRFYQSSYDADEKGTILSVNHDGAGTIVTYTGYLLMAIGMFWALFAGKTRFRFLMKQAGEIYEKRKNIVSVILLLLSCSLSAQTNEKPLVPDNIVSEKFGSLWVQDNDGRIKPLNSLHQEVVIKLVKHNSFKGFTSDQIILGMLCYPVEWQKVPLITVKDAQLKSILGVTGKKASFSDFFTSTQEYKIHQWVEAAYRKSPALRNKLEQELIKVDEQVNVFYMVQTGSLHRIFPSSHDINSSWLSLASETSTLSGKDSLFVVSAMCDFVNLVFQGKQNKAIEEIDGIIRYQKEHAREILPSNTYLETELLYNRLNIFLWLATFFFAFGGVLLLFQFVALLNPSFYFNWLMKAGNILLFAGFIYYTFGLVLRWYISGHAPWSNGYESMVYIGWTILLAGFLLSQKSSMVLPITGLFAGVVLMVAHLSWMNPQITNLVPVLKSYWLTLHVAIIIGGYGFLALGALLGFLNLLITVFKNKTNQHRLQMTIDELTAINEMSLIAGLYLMTIGSFLGGVWANESWGRYWGWDPKETWSLVTIMLYAFVIHMRLIPGLRGFMAFNIASLITFSSVIMTYLGVNYYLTGLHSYAGGDPVSIPASVYYSIVAVIILILSAQYNQYRLDKLKY